MKSAAVGGWATTSWACTSTPRSRSSPPTCTSGGPASRRPVRRPSAWLPDCVARAAYLSLDDARSVLFAGRADLVLADRKLTWVEAESDDRAGPLPRLQPDAHGLHPVDRARLRERRDPGERPDRQARRPRVAG